MDAIGDYEFHVSGVKITGQQLLEAVLTGSRAVRGGPGAVTLTMAMKLLHSIVRDNYQDWMRGGGVPGINKPFREANSNHPPNAAIVAEMNKMKLPEYLDCSEIAEDFLRIAGGKGRIINVTPAKGKKLWLVEYGKEDFFEYHQAFTDGKYVYDPRLSKSAVPKGDWMQMIEKLNPGVKIK